MRYDISWWDEEEYEMYFHIPCVHFFLYFWTFPNKFVCLVNCSISGNTYSIMFTANICYIMLLKPELIIFCVQCGKRETKIKKTKQKKTGYFLYNNRRGGGGGAAYQRAVLKGFRTFARIRFSNIVYFPNSFNPEKKKFTITMIQLKTNSNVSRLIKITRMVHIFRCHFKNQK